MFVERVAVQISVVVATILTKYVNETALASARYNIAWKAVVEKGSTRLAITRGLAGPKQFGNPKLRKGMQRRFCSSSILRGSSEFKSW